MNSVRTNNLKFDISKVTVLDCTDLGMRQFEFVEKTLFLYLSLDFMTDSNNFITTS